MVPQVTGEPRHARAAGLPAGAPARSRGRSAAGAARALALLAPLTALLWAGASCSRPSRPGTPPRHVLLITVDTLRADHLGAWGYPRPTSSVELTPEQRAKGEALAIDDLAAQGVVFANAFAPRGMTFPSIATLFTGRSPLETCALANRDTLPGSAVTLAEVLRENGWRTAAFSANPLLAPRSGIEQGFETFGSFGPRKDEDRDLLVVQAALDWLAGRDPDERLFLWLHLIGPHMPYDPGPVGEARFDDRFTDPDYTGDADGSREFLDGVYESGEALSGEDVDHVVSLYDGEVARANHLLRAFLQVWSGVYEEERGSRWADTLLVFASDHGEELHQRNRYWAHSKSVYSSVLHVPLVLRHPASLTGSRVVDEVVELQDVLPTLTEWLELETPRGVRGRSLLALVDRDPREEFVSRPAIGTWNERVFTARTPRWRLVWNPERVEPDDPPAGPYPIPEVALYDVVADPLELHDVAGAHPDVVAGLRGEILDWLAGLDQCADASKSVSPERHAALQQLGYAGADDDEEER